MVLEDHRYWIFILSLVAVINGLGIVRLLVALGEYLKKRAAINVQHYWVHTLYLVFQLLMHLLVWWSIVGLHRIGELNYLSYLYLLVGPTLLFLSTTILIPELKDESINLRIEYYSNRKSFYSLLSAFYLWAIFVWPVFGRSFSPTDTLLVVFFLIALIGCITNRPKIHAILIIANYIVYISFILLFTLNLNELGKAIAEH